MCTFLGTVTRIEAFTVANIIHLFLFVWTSFLRIIRPIEYAPICLSIKEVAVCAGRKVSMEVDDNILLIVGDPQLIFDQQLGPRQIHLLNTTIILISDIVFYSI
jgi:hypothetical protein